MIEALVLAPPADARASAERLAAAAREAVAAARDAEAAIASKEIALGLPAEKIPA